MALLFPDSPSLGELYPPNPGTSGVTQYKWDGAKWNAVLSSISLGSPKQGAYNDYQWPSTSGLPDQQLTTDGAGNLTWTANSSVSFQALGITPAFDGVSQTYTLVELGTSVFYTPNPATNLVVFVGGVPQIPVISYSVSGNQITFLDPPPQNATFYAVSL